MLDKEVEDSSRVSIQVTRFALTEEGPGQVILIFWGSNAIRLLDKVKNPSHLEFFMLFVILKAFTLLFSGD